MSVYSLNYKKEEQISFYWSSPLMNEHGVANILIKIKKTGKT